MTTVGYGDMSPKTNLGYFIGTLTSISGLLMIGFTVPILANNFVMYYQHTNSTIDREQQRTKSIKRTITQYNQALSKAAKLDMVQSKDLGTPNNNNNNINNSSGLGLASNSNSKPPMMFNFDQFQSNSDSNTESGHHHETNGSKAGLGAEHVSASGTVHLNVEQHEGCDDTQNDIEVVIENPYADTSDLDYANNSSNL